MSTREMTARAAAVDARQERSATLVLLAASLGVLVAQVDTSVVSLAVKPIGRDLGTTVSGMQWMIDVYNLAYAALLLTAGALGDLFGRKRIFTLGIACFAAGSIVCAIAPSTGVLLVGRAISGVGAAFELPMSLVLLALAYPDERARRRALGIWASCNGLAFVVGPTLGGLLVETVGWRSIFSLVLPLCAGALALAQVAVEESADPKGRRLDLGGQVAAVAALGGLAFACIEGTHVGWTATPVVVALLTALLGITAFGSIEARRSDGLVPFGLFRSRPFSGAVGSAGLMTFGIYALVFLLPLFFQTMRGERTLMAGIHMLPLSVTFLIVSQFNGPILHAIGPRATMAWGMTAMGIGEIGCAFPSAGTPYGWIAAALVVVGVGLGLNTAAVNGVAVASVPRERTGTASGLLNTARMVGATLGVAILGAVFAHFAGPQALPDRFRDGLRAALLIGGLAELAGTVVVLWCIGDR